MAKVAFVNMYEANALGPRVLAAWLRRNKHETHNFLFKDIFWIEQKTPQESHLGYQFVQNARLLLSGYDVRPFSSREIELLVAAIADYKPDVLGFSARSANNVHLPRIAPALREGAPGALLVAGGYGPTLDPERYLDAGFDVVVRGDGEEALLELADGCKQPSQLLQVRNTSWKRGNVCIHNPLRAQEKNIDKYPGPLYGDRYFTFIDDNVLRKSFDPTAQSGIYCTFFGRGCIGKCTYCSGGQWSALYKKDKHTVYKRRNRDIDTIISELKEKTKNINKYVYLLDEYFVLSTEKAREFFIKYRDHIKIPFFTFLNYEQMLTHRDLFELVLDAGLDHTGVGMQAGSERLARTLYNRSIKNDIYLEYINILFENNVSTGVNFIGGNSCETEEDFDASLKIIKQIPFSISDPKKNFLVNIRLKIHPHTPIASLAPQLVTNPMPASEWYYRAMLMECRRILDDDEFAELRARRVFQTDPVALKTFYDERLFAKQRSYFSAQIARLQSQGAARDTVFYGCGDLYNYNKTFFAGLSPKAILVDSAHMPSGVRSMDGIPLVATEDFMRETPDVSVLIFSLEATRMQRKLVRTWGMKNENILTITNILDAK